MRKLIAASLFPAALCAELMAAGLILLLMTRRKVLGRIFLSAGVFLFFAVSQNAVGNALLRPLESKYPALHDPAEAASNIPGGGGLRWIVVLGGGYRSGADLPITSRLSAASLYRLIEGIRLHRRLPGSRLILSGGVIWGGKSEGRGMRDVAVALGVSEENLIIEEKSRNTREQAVNIGKIAGKNRFILVTSASHMPRAVAMFRKEKMDPIPAPVGHRVGKSKAPILLRLLPSAGAISNARRATYEYLGLTWAKLRGQID